VFVTVLLGTLSNSASRAVTYNRVGALVEMPATVAVVPVRSIIGLNGAVPVEL